MANIAGNDRPTKTGAGRARLVALGLLALCLAATLVPLPNEYRARWIAYLMDVLHVPLLACVYLLACMLTNSRAKSIFISAILIVGIEAAQAMTSRTASWIDIGLGAWGVATGVSLQCIINQRRRWPTLLAGCVVVVSISTVVPALYAGPVLWDAFAGWRQFPVLAEFKSASSLSRWFIPANNIELVNNDASGGGSGRFLIDEQRSVILMPIVGDWSGYQFVCIEYTAAKDASIDFSVRDGLPLEKGKPRHVVRFDLEAGNHVWKVRIDDLPSGDRFSPVDLERVQSVHWFLDSTGSTPKKRVEFDIRRVWLE